MPVSDGIEAEVIQARSANVLTEQQTILFLDKGREDGVAPGDVFELWRTPEERWDAATTVAEPMGRLQVVRVGDHTSSALVVQRHLGRHQAGHHGQAGRQAAELSSTQVHSPSTRGHPPIPGRPRVLRFTLTP